MKTEMDQAEIRHGDESNAIMEKHAKEVEEIGTLIALIKPISITANELH